MKFGNRLFNSEIGFRSQLLSTISLGVICMAIIASFSTSWVTSEQIASAMVDEGRQVSGALAQQSVLALLYDSAENGAAPVDAIMSFPNVTRVCVLDADFEPLNIKGADISCRAEEYGPFESADPRLVRDTYEEWHFVAPVEAGMGSGDEDPESHFLLGDPKGGERLGYACVVMDKAALRDLQFGIFLNNSYFAIGVFAFLLLLLNLGVVRLTRPLYELAALMKVAEAERRHFATESRGPREFTNLAGVFNRMMMSLQHQDEQLRMHGDLLESEVAIRTQELVQARDAALSASRHKSEFLANMSHELRTPLQSILGYADIVREDLELEGMEENAADLGRVLGSGQRLLSLINNILDLAKIEAGRMDLRLQPVVLGEVVREAADTVIPLMRTNENRIEVDLRNDLGKVEIDREKLLQMMLNLLSNAGKFTEKGTVSLRVVREEHLLTVTVADTGVGLTAEQQKIIFEEFRQVDGSATRHFEGTGLGLAITKRFCLHMGGTIEVESELGKGSAFIIRLPLPIRASHQEEVELIEPPVAEDLECCGEE